jgi:hypothetical protein
MVVPDIYCTHKGQIPWEILNVTSMLTIENVASAVGKYRYEAADDLA